jgi:hypothetical protein
LRKNQQGEAAIRQTELAGEALHSASDAERQQFRRAELTKGVIGMIVLVAALGLISHLWA